MKSSKGLAVLTGRLLCGAAIAAVAASAASAQSDEIVVTATKREQTLQQVPIAVSVVGEETIKDAQIVDIIDLQASVPSLRVTQQQNASQTNFIIRGFGNGANNPGIEPSVGVFIDGVYRSRSAAAILDLPDLERVEILRGPQSTLFGKNVSAGAISITTKLPTYEWEGSAEASFGNYSMARFRGTLSGPISETLAFRVSGSTNNREGTYQNLVTDRDNLNERDRWAVRGQLLWEPTDTFSARLIGDYNKIDEVCCGTVQVLNGPITAGVIGLALGGIIAPDGNPGARISAVDEEPANQLTGKGASLQADWDLGFGVVTSITSYREQSDRNDTDVDFTSIDLAVRPQAQNYETFTQELRIAGEWETGAGVFNWLLGGFYFDESVTSSQSITFGDDFRAFGDVQLAALGSSFLAVEGATQVAGALVNGAGALFPEFQPTGGATVIPFGGGFASGAGFTGDYVLDNQSFSLFFQTDWAVTDRLTITGGVSYTNDKKEAVGNTVQTEPFQNTDLSQFATSGGSFVAASIFGGLIGTPFNPANPTPFFVAAQTLAFTNPMQFAAFRSAAVSNAQLALAGNPALNPLLSLTGLGSLQFIPPQTSFPQVGAVRDDEISLSDDGYAVDDAFNVTARVAYDVTDSLNAYFSYSTGYKAPAINLSQDAAPPTLGVNGLAVGRFAAAEEVTVFELGAKASFDGGFINIALFDQKIDNFQSNTFTGTGFVFANAGSQSVRGFEVEAFYSPVEALNLFFGITYLDPNYDSFVAFPCPSAGLISIAEAAVVTACSAPGVSTVDITGRKPSGIHPVSLSTSASYAFDLGGGNTLTPRVEYLYESETSLYELGNGTEPNRKVSEVNANIAFAMENGFSLNVWGRNITNDDSLITFFPSVAQAGSISAYVAQPRTWGVSIGKSF